MVVWLSDIWHPSGVLEMVGILVIYLKTIKSDTVISVFEPKNRCFWLESLFWKNILCWVTQHVSCNVQNVDSLHTIRESQRKSLWLSVALSGSLWRSLWLSGWTSLSLCEACMLILSQIVAKRIKYSTKYSLGHSRPLSLWLFQAFLLFWDRWWKVRHRCDPHVFLSRFTRIVEEHLRKVERRRTPAMIQMQSRRILWSQKKEEQWRRVSRPSPTSSTPPTLPTSSAPPRARTVSGRCLRQLQELPCRTRLNQEFQLILWGNQCVWLVPSIVGLSCILIPSLQFARTTTTETDRGMNTIMDIRWEGMLLLSFNKMSSEFDLIFVAQCISWEATKEVYICHNQGCISSVTIRGVYFL